MRAVCRYIHISLTSPLPEIRNTTPSATYSYMSSSLVAHDHLRGTRPGSRREDSVPFPVLPPTERCPSAGQEKLRSAGPCLRGSKDRPPPTTLGPTYVV